MEGRGRPSGRKGRIHFGHACGALPDQHVQQVASDVEQSLGQVRRERLILARNKSHSPAEHHHNNKRDERPNTTVQLNITTITNVARENPPPPQSSRKSLP